MSQEALIMNQSRDSFNALLIALGLWEPAGDTTYTTVAAEAQKQNINPLNGRISRLQMDPSHIQQHINSCSDEDSLPTDEASLFGQEFLSDFEIYSDEDSDGDYSRCCQPCTKPVELLNIRQQILCLHGRAPRSKASRLLTPQSVLTITNALILSSNLLSLISNPHPFTIGPRLCVRTHLLRQPQLQQVHLIQSI